MMREELLRAFMARETKGRVEANEPEADIRDKARANVEFRHMLCGEAVTSELVVASAGDWKESPESEDHRWCSVAVGDEIFALTVSSENRQHYGGLKHQESSVTSQQILDAIKKCEQREAMFEKTRSKQARERRMSAWSELYRTVLNAAGCFGPLVEPVSVVVGDLVVTVFADSDHRGEHPGRQDAGWRVAKLCSVLA